MPGVIVQSSSRPGPSAVVGSPGGTYMVSGITERGPVDRAVEVLSISDYVDQLGDRVSYGSLYDDLQVFFAEGGTRALVTRVVGTTPVTGTLQLLDRAVSPLPTLKVDAKDPGAWSTRIKVSVAAAAVSGAVDVTVLFDDVIAEQYTNLANPAAIASAMAVSRYVNVSNLASATAAPNNMPAILAATVLSTGTDDRGTVTSTSYTTALERFGPDQGWGAVAVPGQPASAIGDDLIDHCVAARRLAILAPAANQTPSQAKAATVAFLTKAGSQCAGLAYPWIRIEDGAGGLRSISPEGYVAACRARAHATPKGSGQAPAGTRAQAKTIVATERVLTKTEVDDLNANHVIPIATIGGVVELYGWRSLSTDLRNWRLLTGWDTNIEIAGLGERALEDFVFGNVDPQGHFFDQVQGAMRQILEPMLSAGILYEKTAADGTVISPAYTIDTGPSVNTEQSLALDQVVVDVAYRSSPTGELIVLRLTKVAFDSNAL